MYADEEANDILLNGVSVINQRLLEIRLWPVIDQYSGYGWVLSRIIEDGGSTYTMVDGIERNYTRKGYIEII